MSLTKLQERASSRDIALVLGMKSLNELAALYNDHCVLTFADLHHVADLYNWRCGCCAAKHTVSTPLTFEHIYPLGQLRIGQNRACNVRMVCAGCKRGSSPGPQLVAAPSGRHKWQAFKYAFAA